MPRPAAAEAMSNRDPTPDEILEENRLLCERLAELGEASAALRRSETLLRLVWEGSADGMRLTDGTGTVRMANESFGRLVGLPRARVEGAPMSEIYAPDRRESVLRKYRERFAARAVRTHDETEFELWDGRRRWFAVANSFLDVPGQEPLLLSIFHDVTDRRRAEEAMREADRQKDEFLAVLAHELRNPLATIRAALEVLRLRGPDRREAAGWAREMIGRQLAHLVRLVDDLLDTSRLSLGKIALRREPVDLADVVAQAVEASRPLIGSRGQALTVEPPREPIRLSADRTRLVQVVSNLLSNAAKYTDPGGRITLAAGREGEEAVVRVRDTGIGIRAEILPRVFDLFEQAGRSQDRALGGLGIGLALVKRLVELHGGVVEAHSDGPGRGSEFIVRLPLAPEEVGPRPAAPAEGQSPGGPGRRVLVVDDNADAAESLAVLLRMRGHEVHVARDGPQALETARAVRPEVVLLDLALPGLDGYEVAAQLRGHPELRRARLVAVTGYGRDEDRRRTRAAGFDEHLVKPVDLADLEGVLRPVTEAEGDAAEPAPPGQAGNRPG